MLESLQHKIGNHKARDAAYFWIKENGFPTYKHDSWKYFNSSHITNNTFKLPTTQTHDVDSQIDPTLYSITPHNLVFINGTLAKQYLPAGIQVSECAEIEPKSFADAFDALNDLYFGKKILLSIESQRIIDAPINMIFVSTNGFIINPKIEIVVGKDSNCKIVESHVGAKEDSYFNNVSIDVSLDNGAHLEHYKLQHESGSAYHTARTNVIQKSGSRFDSYYYSFGGKIARNEIRIKLLQHNATTNLIGFYATGPDQYHDMQTRIDHESGYCTSREKYKGIIGNEGCSVFDGLIFVNKNAIKTDGEMLNKNLVLADNATANTRPRLEIFADDVKCKHGATVGKLDETSMLYMRTRGIQEHEIKQMLTTAFAYETTKCISIDSLRDYIERIIANTSWK